jgi:hypothetical protein
MLTFEDILSKSYASFDQMELDVIAAAKNGNFMITRKGTEYTSGKVMLKGTFCCHKSGKSKTRSVGTAKTDCGFKIHFRMKTSSGVYAFSANHHLTHNHPMDPATTGMSAVARRFAPQQLDIIHSMHSNGSTATQTVAELRGTTDAVVLTRSVYNSRRYRERKYHDGISEVQTLISSLGANTEFVHQYMADGEDHLLALIFACKRSLEQFAAFSFVLLMDCTYKTNRFNLPFLLFSSVNPLGYSYVVACCLLKDETINSYNQALSSFKRCFGSREIVVNSVITDQDGALMNAVATQFPDSHHQLCRFHIQQNVKKNVGKNRSLCTKFTQYMHCVDRDDAEKIYESMQRDASSYESAYIEHLYNLRDRYCEVWTSGYGNLGITTTQRAESLNRAFKSRLSTNSRLIDLFSALRDMVKTQEETRVFNEFQMRERPRVYPALISSHRGKVSRFLLDLLEGQHSQIRFVQITHTGEDCTYFLDSNQLSEEGCTCPFFIQYRAPCAHILLCNGENAFDMIHPGWIISDAQITEPAILQGPSRAPQISAEDMRRAEAMAKISDIHTRLVDMDTEAAILFATKFQDMLNRGSLHEPAMIPDPSVSNPRGRPSKPKPKPKPKKNSYRGKPNI